MSYFIFRTVFIGFLINCLISITGFSQDHTVNNFPFISEKFDLLQINWIITELDRRICSEIYSPFHEFNRNYYESIQQRIVGLYGDYRSSPIAGHKHAGIDLKGDFSEFVFPVGKGQVVLIFRRFPHRTVVIKHWFSSSEWFYSFYVHVEDVQVKIGEWVNENTVLARLFTKEELDWSDFGTLNHLHLEIRNSIEDEGRASWQSMTMDELNQYCMDPLRFFQEYMRE
jgi:murein DD-endopeptidase MepM/ murein hydrolase activator NlpD